MKEKIEKLIQFGHIPTLTEENVELVEAYLYCQKNKENPVYDEKTGEEILNELNDQQNKLYNELYQSLYEKLYYLMQDHLPSIVRTPATNIIYKHYPAIWNGVVDEFKGKGLI